MLVGFDLFEWLLLRFNKMTIQPIKKNFLSSNQDISVSISFSVDIIQPGKTLAFVISWYCCYYSIYQLLLKLNTKRESGQTLEKYFSFEVYGELLYACAVHNLLWFS